MSRMCSRSLQRLPGGGYAMDLPAHTIVTVCINISRKAQNSYSSHLITWLVHSVPLHQAPDSAFHPVKPFFIICSRNYSSAPFFPQGPCINLQNTLPFVSKLTRSPSWRVVNAITSLTQVLLKFQKESAKERNPSSSQTFTEDGWRRWKFLRVRS